MAELQSHTKKVLFNHAVLGGSAYDVGVFQGKIIGGHPGWLEYISSGGATGLSGNFKMVLKEFEHVCPKVNEEIQGMADTLHISPENVIYYYQSYLQPAHCSHFVLLPSMTEDGHVLVGRNFDWSDTADDLRLCTTRVQGSLAHIGFSIMLFGRSEGMNECGLSVTTSSGGIPVGTEEVNLSPIQAGFQFWVLVRVLLENCKTVDEALSVIKNFPVCCNPIIMLADRKGNAALVEMYGNQLSIKKIDQQHQCLFATNHFTQPEMLVYQNGLMNHSLVRWQTMKKELNTGASLFNKERAKTLLATRYPEGLCCHYYPEFFGTVHSMLFDLTALDMEVCFGSPSLNNWNKTNLAYTMKGGEISSLLPQETSTKDFWISTPQT